MRMSIFGRPVRKLFPILISVILGMASLGPGIPVAAEDPPDSIAAAALGPDGRAAPPPPPIEFDITVDAGPGNGPWMFDMDGTPYAPNAGWGVYAYTSLVWNPTGSNNP